ncbi:MAG TPA: hypothetical protein PK299_15900, partial [Anaerolineales bacterium]|nr:hypothetical protein [Anaerolineales bacterium]
MAQDDIIIVSKPKWDLVKINRFASSGYPALFSKGSGPNGEDGYVMPFYLFIRYTGSPKGLEPLTTGDIVIGDDVSQLPPYAVLMNWNYSNAGNVYGVPDGCANIPGDTGPTSSTATTQVANGGTCVAVQPGGAGTPVTITLNGVDSTLRHIPTTISGYSPNVFDPNNFHASTNNFYVAAKYVTFWAPFDQVPYGTFTHWNTFNLLTSPSVTGQTNVEPDSTTFPTTTNNKSQVILNKSITGSFGKGPSYVCLGNPSSCSEPNGLFNSNPAGNIISPGQIFRWNMVYTNTSVFDQTNLLVCDKFDNSKQDFVDGNVYWGTGKPYGTFGYTATPAGVFLNTGYPGFDYSTVVVELGVGGVNGTLNASGVSGWNNYDTSYTTTIPINPYVAQPSTADSEAALAGCADDQSIGGVWYASTASLISAGYQLSDVTKIRIRMTAPYPSGAGLSIITFAQVKHNYKYDIVENNSSTTTNSRVAGDPTLGKYIQNLAFAYADGLTTSGHGPNNQIFSGGRVYLTRTFDAEMYKTSTNYIANQLVTAGSTVNYRLAPRFVSNGATYTDTVIIRDALPPNTSYVSGSARINGVPIAPTVIPNSPLAGYTELVFTLTNQTIPYYGSVRPIAANFYNWPVITFDALFNPATIDGVQIVNWAGIQNSAGESPALACTTFAANTGYNCRDASFSNEIDNPPGFKIVKSVDQTLVEPDTSFNYTLQW